MIGDRKPTPLLITVCLAGMLSPVNANAELTMPEFECTAIEVMSVAGTSLFSKKILSASMVLKAERQIPNGVEYQITDGKMKLTVDLVGSPPSRQGTLVLSEKPPLHSALLAKLTCH